MDIKLAAAGLGLLAVGLLGAVGPAPNARDESPFVKGLGPGERETILYVWVRDGDGKDSDFLAVVDVDPGSDSYGRITATAPTNSPANEAHHFGYNVEADRILAAGLFTNRLFIYDVGTDPHNPTWMNTVDLDPTGYSGPHTMFAVPGGVMLAMLGTVDGGGPGALVLVDDDGNFQEAWPVLGPTGEPGYMYDVGVKLGMNRMVTSGWAHPGGIKDGTGMQHAGTEAVVWDWTEKKILQVEDLDAGLSEVRWLHGPDGLGGFTNAAFGNTIWYWEDADEDGTLEFTMVIDLGEGATPADMRISYDNRFLYISLRGGGKVVQYDIADPKTPTLVGEVAIPKPTMMRLSPDSERLYVTNSLLSSQDDEVEFGAWLINVGADGMVIDEGFAPDFRGFPTGAGGPHDMLLK